MRVLCSVHVFTSAFYLFLFQILSQIFIFNHFFLRYDIQVFPIAICRDFYLHEPCNTEMIINPFGVSTLLCIIVGFVQKIFIQPFQEK